MAVGRKCYILPYFFPLQSLGILRRTADNLKDPLFRFFEREVSLMHCQWETPLETCTLFIHADDTYSMCVLRLPGIALQIKFGVKLLKLVRGDLLDVIHVCETKLKQTNYLRSLISDLVKGTYEYMLNARWQ